MEPDEVFTVEFTVTQGAATLLDSIAEITIVNDDSSLSITADAAVKSEGDAGPTPFTFTVTRTGDLGSAVSASYTVAGSGSDPAEPADFVGGAFPTGVVSFGSGESSATVTIEVQGDGVFEGDETFTVTLSAPVGNAQIVGPTAAGRILNDEPSYRIVATDAEKAEGDAGPTDFTFTIFRDLGASAGADTLTLNVAGSGPNPADLGDLFGAPSSLMVDFGPGETSKTVIGQVNGDLSFEQDETFTVEIVSSSAGIAIAQPTAVGVIRNDDVGYRVESDDAVKKEGQTGATSFTFTIFRDGGATAGADAISWSVSGSGANPADATDFFGGALPSGMASFAAGATSATVTVAVAGDATLEADETFTLTLGPPASGADVVDSTADGTILNDEAVISITPLEAVKPEGGQPESPDVGPAGFSALAGPTESSDGGKIGGGWGDPHYYTFGGLSYDFQGRGEYVLVRSTGPDDVEVQIRTTPYGSSQTVSVHRGVATMVEGHRITVDNERGTPLFIDGAAQPSMRRRPSPSR